MHPVNRRLATQYLHTESVTTRRTCGRNGKHEAPHELSAQTDIGIAANEADRKVSRAARGGDGGGQWGGMEEAVEGGPLSAG